MLDNGFCWVACSVSEISSKSFISFSLSSVFSCNLRVYLTVISSTVFFCSIWMCSIMLA